MPPKVTGPDRRPLPNPADTGISAPGGLVEAERDASGLVSTCPECGQRFPSPQEMGTHRRGHVGTIPLRYARSAGRFAVPTSGEPRADMLAELNRGAREWVNQAACRGMDTAIFFPERGESTKEAKDVCKVCPVRVECHGYARAHSIRDGIWGGDTGRQRREKRSAA